MVFRKLLLSDNSRNQIFNRNRIKDYPKRIDYVLKLKITELLTHIFGKTRTYRKDLRIIIHRIFIMRYWNFGIELHKIYDLQLFDANSF